MPVLQLHVLYVCTNTYLPGYNNHSSVNTNRHTSHYIDWNGLYEDDKQKIFTLYAARDLQTKIA